jgi:predicted alpha/beta superfamily hydrolase
VNSAKGNPGTLHLHRAHGLPGGAPGRMLRVWTPAGYDDEPERRFPVVYLQDGQNVLDDATAFAGHGWRLHATAQRLINQGKLPPLLLVAVHNAGAHRTEDYTPVPWHGRGGHADLYADQLLEVIKPFVDQRYRTLPGPEHTALVGASLGGLFALCAGLRLSHVFGQIGALSPSVFWADGHLLRIAGRRKQLPLRIWLDAGKRETPALRSAVRALAVLLESQGYTKHRSAPKASLRYTEIAGAGHDEASWGKRGDRVLKFLFPLPPKPKRRKKTANPKRPTS